MSFAHSAWKSRDHVVSLDLHMDAEANGKGGSVKRKQYMSDRILGGRSGMPRDDLLPQFPFVGCAVKVNEGTLSPCHPVKNGLPWELRYSRRRGGKGKGERERGALQRITRAGILEHALAAVADRSTTAPCMMMQLPRSPSAKHHVHQPQHF